MKTQISNLVRGNQSRVGSTSDLRKEIASKVISENPEFLKVRIRGNEINLTANWSLSGKSVNYFGSIPVSLYELFFSNFGLPVNNPSASILINGDMTVNFQTNSKKAMYQWIDESEIEII